jgi:hypothetical protein
MPVGVTSPPDRPRGWRGGSIVGRGLALMLPAMVLAACGPLPFPVAGPVTPFGQPRPRKPPAGADKARAVASPPSLAPLATQQQVVKAVRVGRRDPFGEVLKPQLTIPKDTKPKAEAKATVLEWPKGLAFEGVLQTFSESEAMVRYSPADAKGGGARYGSLRVGDIGTGAVDSLLPPGWQVAAIDGEQGVLVLRSGGQIISRRL